MAQIHILSLCLKLLWLRKAFQKFEWVYQLRQILPKE